ncbi:MAG: aminotransferase class I/II-fold pyridoxal phosphate-dependent enzyme [Actinomycetota bacterium]
MRGDTAREVAASIEEGIREGHLRPGVLLPTVRAAAALLEVSPVTVASAYRILRQRGYVLTDGRRGTRVNRAPALPMRWTQPVPAGVVDLSEGNPDPDLLPSLERALAKIDPSPSLYGEYANLPSLIEVARARLESDGVDATHLGVVAGAADGIERVLQAHLRPGDGVAIEDPVFTRVVDLVAALGLVGVPVALDDRGPIPESLRSVLKSHVRALVLTPRAQNPTGAALDEERADRLREVVDERPDVLIVEDDHAGPIAGTEALTLCTGRSRWAAVRSVSKFLGPDLRLAVVAGDELTMARVQGRQRIGMGWVSHVLQGIVTELWTDPDVIRLFASAARTYAGRRAALIQALASEGITSTGRSGLNVWVEVAQETEIARGLLQAGWAVAPGERYRIASPPAIRVTAARLEPDDAARFTLDLARLMRPGKDTYLA